MSYARRRLVTFFAYTGYKHSELLAAASTFIFILLCPSFPPPLLLSSTWDTLLSIPTPPPPHPRPELTSHILDILQFSAKIAHPLQFHVIWEDTLRRLRGPEDWNQDLCFSAPYIKRFLRKLGFRNRDSREFSACEEKLAAYLEEWILQKKGRWWSASWQSGLGQVCPGYGTYVSNSQERVWRTLKGLLKKGFVHQDVSHLVRETASSMQTWVRSGQYANAVCQVCVPPPSLAFSAKRLKAGGALMQKWHAKEGRRMVNNLLRSPQSLKPFSRN